MFRGDCFFMCVANGSRVLERTQRQGRGKVALELDDLSDSLARDSEPAGFHMWQWQLQRRTFLARKDDILLVMIDGEPPRVPSEVPRPLCRAKIRLARKECCLQLVAATDKRSSCHHHEQDELSYKESMLRILLCRRTRFYAP